MREYDIIEKDFGYVEKDHGWIEGWGGLTYTPWC